MWCWGQSACPRISPVVKNAREVLCFDSTGEECRPHKVSFSVFMDVIRVVVLNQCRCVVSCHGVGSMDTYLSKHCDVGFLCFFML